jgi:phosphate transport system substrate-binding protein
VRSFAAFGLSALLMALPLPAAQAQEVMGSDAITGAGSTFAYPILSRWARGYQDHVAGRDGFFGAGGGLDDAPAKAALDYEPSGSLAGTMRVKDRAVDFGASDVPMASAELQKLQLGQFPIVIGGVVAVVNVEGVQPGAIKFTGTTLADVFLGKVTRWNDPAIATQNPDLKLPDAEIAVVHRSEGSGTTFNFAQYLAKASPEWRQRIGVGTLLEWPVGAAVRGNEGVANAVKATANSIGYVEYAQAVKSELSYAQIQNGAGLFISPGATSFQAAAGSADWAGAGDFGLLLTEATGTDAYPIAATVFVLMHKEAKAPQRTRRALRFFEWSLAQGAADASTLGYVPLPASLIEQIKTYWLANFGEHS